MIRILTAIAMTASLLLLLPQTALAAKPTLDVYKEEQSAKLKVEMDEAMTRVIDIINQPITHVTRLPEAKVKYFSPGWFHGGVVEPDFEKVDVTKTQAFPYEKFDYVTSDLNPNEMFIGKELEFNPATKYFYMDLNLPKKRLSESEMAEINRLYRVIGRTKKEIDALKDAGNGKFKFFKK